MLELLERTPLGDDRGRILLTLVDRRTRVDEAGRDLYERLVAAIDERGWHRFGCYLSRSPRVEALNSATQNPGSILHHARGTQVYAQLRALAEEVMAAVDPEGKLAGVRSEPAPRARPGGGRRALRRPEARPAARSRAGTRLAPRAAPPRLAQVFIPGGSHGQVRNPRRRRPRARHQRRDRRRHDPRASAAARA